MSPDTIVPSNTNPQSLNRLSYVTNNPLRYTDPTGHMQAEDRYKSSNGTCNADDRSCNWVGKSKKPKRDKNRERDDRPTHPAYPPTPTPTPPTPSPTVPPTVTLGPSPTYTPTSTSTNVSTPFRFTPTNTPTPQPPTNTPTETLTVTPSATLPPPTITPTPTYNIPWRGPPGCEFDSPCWAEAAELLDPPTGAGGRPSVLE